MNEFLVSNDWQWRLARTIVQGVIGVFIANIDVILGYAKMEEMAAIGDSAQSPAVPKYASAPEKIWDSVEECDEALKSLTVPVGYCFGTIDPLLQDYWESNLYAIMNTKGARAVILEGECHLMELDCPDRVAAEVFAFIDESRKSY